jgi:hypothetical protein
MSDCGVRFLYLRKRHRKGLTVFEEAEASVDAGKAYFLEGGWRVAFGQPVQPSRVNLTMTPVGFAASAYAKCALSSVKEGGSCSGRTIGLQPPRQRLQHRPLLVNQILQLLTYCVVKEYRTHGQDPHLQKAIFWN